VPGPRITDHEPVRVIPQLQGIAAHVHPALRQEHVATGLRQVWLPQLEHDIRRMAEPDLPERMESLEEHRETPRSSNSPKTKWPAFSDAGHALFYNGMPWPGFEPGCLAALPPQDSVSTSFTTRAGPPT